MIPNFYLSSYYMDIRSLALFRILFGTLLLYDLFIRLSLGKYDLAWYTSEGPSYLRAGDTPHRAPLHQFWFYRGSAAFQMGMFALAAVLAVLFTLGLFCNAGTKLLLFLIQVHQQSKCMPVADGSDSFSRHLLLWSIFLPVEACWSLDAVRRQQRLSSSSSSNKQQQSNTNTISGLACLAMLTQIMFMYVGTVMFRTIDLGDWTRSEWLPPKLTAAHYALADEFASRDNILTRLVLSNPTISQVMTMKATIVEFAVPLFCWLVWKRRHWGAFLLFGLHVGLLSCFTLRNWQFVGMAVQALWIPTNAWDSWLGVAATTTTTSTTKTTSGSKAELSALEHHKKTDEDNPVSRVASPKPKPPTISKLSPNPISLFFQIFFFGYMIYNWAGMRGWIPKHDNGDIGEGLRLSQYWVMYGTLSHKTAVTQLTGKTKNFMETIDLYHYIRTRGERIKPDPPNSIPHNMTDHYPSTRWERAIAQWAQDQDMSGHRSEYFCKSLCVLLNQEFGTDWSVANPRRINSVSMVYKKLHSLPPGSDFRYREEEEGRYLVPHRTYEVNCQHLETVPVMEPQIKP